MNVLFYRISNRVKRTIRSSKINLQPTVGDLLAPQCMFGIEQSLSEIAGAVESRNKDIADLQRHFGRCPHWKGMVTGAAPFRTQDAELFDVAVDDLGVVATASLEAADGARETLVVLPHHRLAAATPKVLQQQLSFLDGPALENIRREVWRHRHGTADATLVLAVRSGQQGSAFYAQRDALVEVVMAAMVPWLVLRDANAHFTPRAVRRQVAA